MPDESRRVTNNATLSRYEVVVDGHTAFLDYRDREPVTILVHTDVPVPLRGSGLAHLLARHALDEARASGRRVVVRCPFVTTFLKRHPEYADLVA